MKKSYLNKETGKVIQMEETALGYLLDVDKTKLVEQEAPELPDVVKSKKGK